LTGQLKGEALARTADFAQLTLSFVDPIQWRYEVIRPVVLLRDTTPQQRAYETHTHPYTVRRLVRQFQARGMLGLLPRGAEGGGTRGVPRVSDAIRPEIHRLKALYEGFHYRELARILFIKFRQPIDHKTVKASWPASPVSPQEQSEPWAYHAYSDRAQARLAVVKLHYQGWDKVSISRVLRVSRPTVDAILTRFDHEHVAGLADKRRGPKAPRKRWLPVMVQVYHLQKAHPDAGEFRIWSLLAQPDLSARTVGRIMALNRRISEDIPHVRRKGPKPPPQPHPFKARRSPEYWFIDGRPMDFTLEGVTWWSLVLLEGYSRTMLAGVVAPAEATWAALMVLYTACLQYGVPEHLVSDGGGAYTSTAFKAVCQRRTCTVSSYITCSGARRTGMAAWRCTTTTSLSQRGCRNSPCWCGSRATCCGWPVRAWSWPRTTVVTIGGRRRSRTSEALCSIRRGSHRPKETCCPGASSAGWSSIAPARLGGGNRTPASRRSCRYSRRARPHEPAEFPIEVKVILARAAPDCRPARSTVSALH
jgi:winged helix-turn helix protein